MKTKRKTVKMAIKIFVIAIVLFFIILQLIPAPVSLSSPNPFRREGGRPLILAHGGAKDLYPENTMLAFDGSAEIGCDVLEMDVCLTNDGRLVTHHNLTIDATTEKSGKVKDFTYDELRQINFGAKFKALDGSMPYRDSHVEIALLDDLLAKYKDTHLFMIELKDNGEDGKIAAQKLYDLISALGVQEKVVVCSFSESTLAAFRTLAGETILTASSTETTTNVVISSILMADALYKCPDNVMSIPIEQKGIKLDTKGVVNSGHERNMAVIYWTIDSKDEMKRLIELGADGIITDRPDLMHEVLQEMGF